MYSLYNTKCRSIVQTKDIVRKSIQTSPGPGKHNIVQRVQDKSNLSGVLQNPPVQRVVSGLVAYHSPVLQLLLHTSRIGEPCKSYNLTLAAWTGIA